MATQGLAALDLGPPTGPIVEWQRAQKRQTRRCEGPDICPISQEELEPGQEYYSFLENKKVAY